MSDLTNRRLYYSTAIVDGSKEIDYLDTNIQKLINKPEDIEYIVPDHLVGRIDLISVEIYGTPKLWWLIAWVNDIIDPTFDLYTGMRLKLPRMIDYYNFYQEYAKIDTNDGIFDRRQLDLI